MGRGDTRDERPRLGYGEMRDRIEIADIHGKAAPATIESTDVRDMAPVDSRRSDNKIILTFREFPGKEYICNATSYKTLCEKLGKDERQWIGQVCVLAPTVNEYDGRSYEKVHIAAPDAWVRVLAAVAKATGGKRR